MTGAVITMHEMRTPTGGARITEMMPPAVCVRWPTLNRSERARFELLMRLVATASGVRVPD